MKRLGLSLVTASLLVSGAIANESLVEALTTNAKIGGEVRIVNTSGNNHSVYGVTVTRDKNSTSGALELYYTTGSFYGFKFGIMGQAGYDFDTYEVKTADEDDFRHTVSDVGISRLWLEYAISKSSITVGRIGIETPLLQDGGTTWPMREAFEGVNVKIDDIKDTHIQLTYFDKWVKRYGNDAYEFGDVPPGLIPTGGLLPPGIAEVQESAESDVKYDNGLWSIYLKNNSYKPLLLEAQYMKVGAPGDNLDHGDGPVTALGAYDQWMLRFDYKLPIPYLLKIGATYGQASFDESQRLNFRNNSFLLPSQQTEANLDPDGDKSDIFGVQITSIAGPVLLKASYTSVGDDNMWPATVGDVPCNMTYTSGWAIPTYFAGVDAYSLQAMYRPVKSVGLMAKFIVGEQSEQGRINTGKFRLPHFADRIVDEWNELMLAVSWDMSFILKGLSSSALVSFTDFSGDYHKVPTNPNGSSRTTFGGYWLNYKF